MHTLGQRRTHDHSPHAAGGLEVSLAALSPAGGQVRVDLRHFGGDSGVLRWKSVLSSLLGGEVMFRAGILVRAPRGRKARLAFLSRSLTFELEVARASICVHPTITAGAFERSRALAVLLHAHVEGSLDEENLGINATRSRRAARREIGKYIILPSNTDTTSLMKLATCGWGSADITSVASRRGQTDSGVCSGQCNCNVALRSIPVLRPGRQQSATANRLHVPIDLERSFLPKRSGIFGIWKQSAKLWQQWIWCAIIWEYGAAKHSNEPCGGGVEQHGQSGLQPDIESQRKRAV